MRPSISAFVSALILVLWCGCGEEPGQDAAADTTQAAQEGTLREAAEEIMQPRQPPSGASALIEEAGSVVEQADQRTDALEEMMGDM